jgi:hypothetical protein
VTEEEKEVTVKEAVDPVEEVTRMVMGVTRATPEGWYTYTPPHVCAIIGVKVLTDPESYYFFVTFFPTQSQNPKTHQSHAHAHAHTTHTHKHTPHTHKHTHTTHTNTHHTHTTRTHTLTHAPHNHTQLYTLSLP